MTRILETARAAEAGTLAWSNIWPGLACIAGLLLVLGTFALTGLKRAVREA